MSKVSQPQEGSGDVEDQRGVEKVLRESFRLRPRVSDGRTFLMRQKKINPSMGFAAEFKRSFLNGMLV